MHPHSKLKIPHPKRILRQNNLKIFKKNLFNYSILRTYMLKCKCMAVSNQFYYRNTVSYA